MLKNMKALNIELEDCLAPDNSVVFGVDRILNR